MASTLPALVQPRCGVPNGGALGLAQGNNGAVSFAQQLLFFHQRFPTSRLIKPFIALPLSSSPVQVIRRDNYSPVKKACFYRRRLIRQDPSKAANPRQFTLNTLHHHSLSLTLIVLRPDGQNQSQSQVCTNSPQFPY